MPRHTHIAVMLAALILPAVAVAEDDKVWPEGSAMQVGGLEVARRDRALKALDRAEARLADLVVRAGKTEPLYFDERTAKALRAQQGAWRAYVEKECDLIGTLSGGASPWRSTRAVRCEANLAEQRVARTRAAARCMAKSAADQHGEPQACLYQLAPVAVPLRR